MIMTNGTAYALFDCGKLLKEIDEELPYLVEMSRKASEDLSDLEVRLNKGTNGLAYQGLPEKLKDRPSYDYNIEATHKRGGNVDAAEWLATILNNQLCLRYMTKERE